jgi:hypothetical protein
MKKIFLVFLTMMHVKMPVSSFSSLENIHCRYWKRDKLTSLIYFNSWEITKLNFVKKKNQVQICLIQIITQSIIFLW